MASIAWTTCWPCGPAPPLSGKMAPTLTGSAATARPAGSASAAAPAASAIARLRVNCMDLSSRPFGNGALPGWSGIVPAPVNLARSGRQDAAALQLAEPPAQHLGGVDAVVEPGLPDRDGAEQGGGVARAAEGEVGELPGAADQLFQRVKIGRAHV